MRPSSGRVRGALLPLALAASLSLLEEAPGSASGAYAGQCTVGCAPPAPRPSSWNTTREAEPIQHGAARLPRPAPRPASWTPRPVGQTNNSTTASTLGTAASNAGATSSTREAAADDTGGRRFPVPAPRLASLLPASSAGPLEATDVRVLRSVLDAARRQKWRQALDASADAKSEIPGIVARGLWLAAEDAKASFVATLDFLEEYPDWPRWNTVRRRLEERIDDRVGHEQVLHLFETEPPLTGKGLLRFAQALESTGETDRAVEFARSAWREHRLSASEELDLLRQFGASLGQQDHVSRLDDRIWSRDWDGARRQVRRVPRQWRRLGEARITLGRRVGGVDRAVARVPASFRDHPGLIYERARWRRRSGLKQAALDMLVPLPPELPNAHRWWDELSLHVRDRLRTSNFAEAYRLASVYPSFEGEERRQGAWLAGWIALELLKRPPEEAMEHFKEARKESWHPADLSLVGYWQFRTALRMGDREGARAYGEEAARWPGTFFGQLALRSLGRTLQLPAAPVPDNAYLAGPDTKSLAEIVRALGQADGSDFAWPFVEALLAGVSSDREAAAVVALGWQAGMPRQALRSARRAVSMGHDMPLLLFQIPSEEQFPRDAVDAELPLPVALAVSNQESGFDRRAVSHAGARGLMQLMPNTARHQARRLSITYQRNRLTEDPHYNIRIGTSFLRDRIDRYEGSIPLALAAYNAGEGNVRKWLRAHGDPRESELDLINWILLIPLAETRGYVQRVMERISAYEILLAPDETTAIPLRHLAS